MSYMTWFHRNREYPTLKIPLELKETFSQIKIKWSHDSIHIFSKQIRKSASTITVITEFYQPFEAYFNPNYQLCTMSFNTNAGKKSETAITTQLSQQVAI